MLVSDPNKRITAIDALNDPWIVKNNSKLEAEYEQIALSLDQLKEFKAHSSLHKAVLTYMAGRMITKKKESKLWKVFQWMDKNGDGQLSKNELKLSYLSYFNGDQDHAERAVQNILKRADLNKNGLIDYKEFLAANINKKKKIMKDRLKQIFDFFDKVKI